MANPFAFAIDYDRSIAQDQREIAHYDSDALKRLTPMMPRLQEVCEANGYPLSACDLYAWITSIPEQRAEVMAIVGLTEADMTDWTVLHEWIPDPARKPTVDTSSWAWADVLAARDRGQAIEARFGRDAFPLEPEERRVKLLARAKANLARHKRHQAKFPGKKR
jgi:hypothetical protein